MIKNSFQGVHMKNSLTCHDLGVQDCSFEVRSENREQIKEAFNQHIHTSHPEKEKQIDEINRLMDQKIHQRYLP